MRCCSRPHRSILRRSGRSTAGTSVIGHNLCAQLGRIYRGHFGWLDATGTFRPVAIDYRGAPSTCGSRRPDLAGEPYFDVVIPITDPRRSEAHAKQLVVWGLAGSGATRVQLRVGPAAVSAPRSAHGAFLATGPAQLRSDQVTGTITYGDRRTIHVPQQSTGMFRPPHDQMVLSGRAPDPNGGLPYALLSNDTCTEWGARILDADRFGTVDYELGTFEERRNAGARACGRSTSDDAKYFAQHPVMLGYGESGDEPGSAPEPGRVARRTQPGTTIFTGRAAPDVIAVTLETPRDVRTLTPAGPAHAIIAVYDGSFPTGSVKVIAQFRDGRTKTETLPNLGF